MGTFIQNHLTYRAEQGTSNCPHSTTDIKKTEQGKWVNRTWKR